MFKLIGAAVEFGDSLPSLGVKYEAFWRGTRVILQKKKFVKRDSQQAISGIRAASKIYEVNFECMVMIAQVRLNW